MNAHKDEHLKRIKILLSFTIQSFFYPNLTCVHIKKIETKYTSLGLLLLVYNHEENNKKKQNWKWEKNLHFGRRFYWPHWWVRLFVHAWDDVLIYILVNMISSQTQQQVWDQHSRDPPSLSCTHQISIRAHWHMKRVDLWRPFWLFLKLLFKSITITWYNFFTFESFRND